MGVAKFQASGSLAHFWEGFGLRMPASRSRRSGKTLGPPKLITTRWHEARLIRISVQEFLHQVLGSIKRMGFKMPATVIGNK